MTPLFRRFNQYFPDWLSALVLSGLYAALLVLILTLLISPQTFGVVYLDIGR
jgi:hypothetical protein